MQRNFHFFSKFSTLCMGGVKTKCGKFHTFFFFNFDGFPYYDYQTPGMVLWSKESSISFTQIKSVLFKNVFPS